MHQFYLDASDTIHALSEGFKKMEEIYHYTCAMFGESAQFIQPSNFFALFKSFKYQYLVSIEYHKSRIACMPFYLLHQQKIV